MNELTWSIGIRNRDDRVISPAKLFGVSVVQQHITRQDALDTAIANGWYLDNVDTNNNEVTYLQMRKKGRA